MTNGNLKADYDVWHRRMYSGSKLSDPLRFAWYKSAFAHVKQNACGKFLEIGCGRGEFAVWLLEVLPTLDITAVDFSTAAIEFARQHAVDKCANIQLRKEDAQDLNFPDDCFDYVLSCECIEHVPQPRKMAAEVCRVLKPGGYFCITTENYFNGMLLAWAKSWITREPFNSGSGIQPYENFFFFWHILKYLRSVGLVIDKTESNHYQWLLLPRVDPSRLCIEQFSAPWARVLAKPFGRHFSFFGRKPAA